MRPIFSPGRVERICYPTHNRLDLPLEFVHREVKILSVRDMARKPLELREFLAAPLLRRGRHLVTGIDLQLGCERSFYIDAAEGKDLPALRLGLYDPRDKTGPLSFFPRKFAATIEDRMALEQTILRFLAETPHKWSGNPFKLAVFPEVKPCRSAS